MVGITNMEWALMILDGHYTIMVGLPTFGGHGGRCQHMVDVCVNNCNRALNVQGEHYHYVVDININIWWVLHIHGEHYKHE